MNSQFVIIVFVIVIKTYLIGVIETAHNAFTEVMTA
jgi:hypothetical protein